jgi:hypothetical protein
MLVVPLPRSARVLLHSDIPAALLEAGVRLVVLRPEEEAARIDGDLVDPRIVFAAARAKECEQYHRFGMRGLCGRIRSCVADGRRDLSTLDGRLQRVISDLRERRPLQAAVASLAVHVLRRVALVRRLWITSEARFFVGHLHASVFAEHHPDLVVMATPGYDSPIETEVLREAKRRRIPTAIVVRGWDNPSAKGLMAAMPDRFIAWTDTMKRELVGYHGVPPARSVVAGAPYLDFYSEKVPVPSRDRFFRDLGLDPCRKLIAFAAKPPGSYAWNLDIIAALAEAIRDERFAVDSQLVVRLYPLKRESQAEADEVAACRTLARSFRHVVLSLPDFEVQARQPREAVEEFGGLRAILKHADVVVNVFSTMAIEAAIHDVPIVTVGYSGRGHAAETGAVLSPRSIDSHARETHNRRLLSHGGTVVARTEDELIAAVGRYLSDRSLDAQGRRRIVDQEVGPNHGSAGQIAGRFLAAFSMGA